MLFAPIMGWLAHPFGWQSVFWTMGALGVALAFIWLGTMRGPKQHPGVDAGGLEWLRAGGALVDLDEGGPSSKRIDTFGVLRELLANRVLLGVYIGENCIKYPSSTIPKEWFDAVRMGHLMQDK